MGVHGKLQRGYEEFFQFMEEPPPDGERRMDDSAQIDFFQTDD